MRKLIDISLLPIRCTKRRKTLCFDIDGVSVPIAYGGIIDAELVAELMSVWATEVMKRVAEKTHLTEGDSIEIKFQMPVVENGNPGRKE